VHEGRILLVDDTPTFLMAARDYLRLHGFDVDTAGSGAEALAAVHDQRPELILLDIQMPEMDGVTFARQLRADRTMEDIPVVAVTALAMPGDRERCLAAGMVDYYTKPISLHRLGEIAEHYLGSDRPAAAPPPV
jgi:CheY-like chemotaxis protein